MCLCGTRGQTLRAKCGSHATYSFLLGFAALSPAGCWAMCACAVVYVPGTVAAPRPFPVFPPSMSSWALRGFLVAAVAEAWPVPQGWGQAAEKPAMVRL